MDYENAKGIIERLQTCLNHDSCENIDCEYFNTFEDLKSLLEWLKDAYRPIVRCKDCRYHYKRKDESETWDSCLLWKVDIYNDFYCANGEIYDGKKWGEDDESIRSIRQKWVF